ncbi:MAG: MarR family transcriptional regulator [Mesorhizobium sp.]|nr:MAG: MarR family transcriptional regulator [Mesorhizobium sp.]
MSLHQTTITPATVPTRRQRANADNAALATIAKRDQFDFNHKAVKVLTAKGFRRSTIAATLELSERSVRRYQSTQCLAWDAERAIELRRISITATLGTVRFQSDDDIEWESMMLGARGDTRASVFDALKEGLSQADIARLLGISPPAVSRHVKEIARRKLAKSQAEKFSRSRLTY